jgi:hypothetical protein
MRLSIPLLLCCIAVAPAQAQEETLAGDGFESGGFGGPVLKITPINGKTGVLIGGRGGWIINHAFILGGGAYGLVTNIAADTPGPGGEPYIEFGYGGVELEYVHQWDKLLHLSFGLLIGGGEVGCRQANGSNSGDSQSFFTMEPWVNGNLNVTGFFRISVGISYRWVTGANSPAASDSDLSGVAGILLLRFGSF